jgi:hypothetical protein
VQAARAEHDGQRGGQHRGGEDDRGVDGREPVDEALRRCPLGLRRLDRAGDAVEGAVTRAAVTCTSMAPRSLIVPARPGRPAL